MFSTSQTGLFVEFDKPFYYPGDIVKGNVYANVYQPLQAEGIELVVKCKEAIHYKDVERQAYKATRRNHQTGRTETYTAYRNVTVNRQDKNEIFKYKCMLYNCGNFQGGQYGYPFSFQIMNNLPGSFEFYDNDMFACIKHTVKAKFKCNNQKIDSSNIMIVRQPTNNFNYPNSVNTNTKMDVCCSDNGIVNLDVKNDKSFVYPGDHLNGVCRLNNKNSKVNATSLHMQVLQEITLVQRGKRAKTHRRVIAQTNFNEMLMAGNEMTKTFNMRVEDTNNPTLRNLNKCKHFNLFRDKNVISKLQASCKSSLITCNYSFVAFAYFEGCCAKCPRVSIPVLFYIPDDLNNHVFVKPDNFQPQMYSSVNVQLPPQTNMMPMMDNQQMMSNQQMMTNQPMMNTNYVAVQTKHSEGVNSGHMMQPNNNNQMTMNQQYNSQPAPGYANINNNPSSEGFSSMQPGVSKQM